MKARHKGSSPKPTGGPGIRSEIAEHLMARKHGGRVEHKKKEHEKEHKAKGGEVHEGKHLEGMHGAKAKFRLDKPGRKRGGRVGCDSSPLSSAGKGDHPHSADDEMGGPRGGEPGYRHGGHVKKKN